MTLLPYGEAVALMLIVLPLLIDKYVSRKKYKYSVQRLLHNTDRRTKC